MRAARCPDPPGEQAGREPGQAAHEPGHGEQHGDHVRAIYGNFGVSSRRDAVDLARRHGMLAEEPQSLDGAG